MNVGTVLQAYLYRSEKDIKELSGIPLRLVKGAYKEPADVAFQEKQQVDDNYLKIIKAHLLSRSYTAIASHNHTNIGKVKEFVKEENIPNSQFEFQLLYGFRNELQLNLVKDGYKVRVTCHLVMTGSDISFGVLRKGRKTSLLLLKGFY